MKHLVRKTLLRAVLYGFAVLVLLAVIASLTEIESERLRDEFQAGLMRIYDRDIEIDHAYFNLLGGVRLEGVRVRNPESQEPLYMIEIPEVRVSLTWRPGEEMPIRPSLIVLESPAAFLVRPRDGEWNTEHLWIERPPPEHRPEFQIPISIRSATVHFFDGDVGDSGMRLDLAGIDADYNITSSEEGIRTSFSASGVELPGGGTGNLSFTVFVPERRAEVDLALSGASLDEFSPYLHFLKWVRLEGGRGDLDEHITFLPGHLEVSASGELSGMDIRGPNGSSEGFDDLDAEVEYEATFFRERAVFHSVDLSYRSTSIHIEGFSTNRRADTPSANLAFSVSRGDASDLLFLLPDERLEGEGRVSGRYRFSRGAETAVYELSANLDDCLVDYGGWIEKPAGVEGGFSLRGNAGAGPRYIDIRLPESRMRVRPFPGGVRISGSRISSSDLESFIVPYRNEIRRRTRIFGSIGADFSVRPLEKGFSTEGEWILDDAAVIVPGILAKPRGTRGRLDLEASVTNGILLARRMNIDIGSSSIRVTGRMASDGERLDVLTENLTFEDAVRFLPVVPISRWENMRGSGSIGADLDIDGRQGRETIVRGGLDLSGSSLSISGILEKPAALSSTLELDGSISEEGFSFPGSRLGIGASVVSLDIEGDSSTERYEISGGATDLSTLWRISRSRIVPNPSLLAIEGPGDIDLSIEKTGGTAASEISLDLTDARVSYGDSFAKPPGVLFTINGSWRDSPGGIDIEGLEIDVGGTRLHLAGVVGPGEEGRVDLDAEAWIRTDELPEYLTAMRTAEIRGRPADEAMASISDPDGMLHLVWDVEGRKDRPEFVIGTAALVQEALGNLLENQVRRFGEIITGTIGAGFDIVERVLVGEGSDSAAVSAETSTVTPAVTNSPETSSASETVPEG